MKDIHKAKQEIFAAIPRVPKVNALSMGQLVAHNVEVNTTTVMPPLVSIANLVMLLATNAVEQLRLTAKHALGVTMIKMKQVDSTV